jgi:molecular chaperone HtpG
MSGTGTETITQEFKAEVKQLLDILAHSLYTNREVFVRELISNAADALYKARFESVRGKEILDPELPFEINIKLDKEKKLFTITDTGIGMTREELISNIGTIARSGTASFLQEINEAAQQEKPDLIGKFGVGFYSVFMAGDKVHIITRSAQKDAEAWRWESDGSGTYTLTPENSAPRGTQIEVHLREDALEFADKFRIENIIRKYSNFVPFPIKIDGEQFNKVSAIWREPKSALKPEQYVEFYKFHANTDEEPLSYLHFSSDAPIQMNVLVFLPKMNYEWTSHANREHAVSLFVRRVHIQTGTKELLPDYLRFLTGIVDTEDLPLNISRETLQENAVIFKIKSLLVKRVLAHLKEMAEKEKDKYLSFWNQFARIMKEGYIDFSNREQVAELLRFNSSTCASSEELISFDEYISRMKETQKSIYYLSASGYEAIKQNPLLEIYQQKGIEVLYLYDPIDEFVMTGLQTYKEKKIQSVDQVDLKELEEIKGEKAETETESTEAEKVELREMDKLCRRIKDILGDKVMDVRISQRLTESPVVLINPDGTMSGQMKKILHLVNQTAELPPQALEINGKHPLIQNLHKIYNQDPKDAYLSQVVEQLYFTALMQDGYMTEPFHMINGIRELLKESSQWYLDRNKVDNNQ